ncbi:hypothetical protein [Laspinema palackyanum]
MAMLPKLRSPTQSNGLIWVRFRSRNKAEFIPFGENWLFCDRHHATGSS